MSKQTAAKIFFLSILGIILIILISVAVRLFNPIHKQYPIYYLDKRSNTIISFDSTQTYRLKVIKAENERIPTQGTDPYFTFSIENNEYKMTNGIDVFNILKPTTRKDSLSKSVGINLLSVTNQYEDNLQITRVNDTIFIIAQVEKKYSDYKDEYEESVQSTDVLDLTRERGYKWVKYDEYTCKLIKR